MKRNARGFMLLEMFIAMILLTAFALVATQVFGWSMRILREAPQAQQEMTRFDTMVATLRADVWSAQRIERIDERSLRLHANDSPPIIWTIDGSTIARSIESPGEPRASQQIWSNLRAALRFDARDGIVIAHLIDEHGQPADELWLTTGAARR